MSSRATETARADPQRLGDDAATHLEALHRVSRRLTRNHADAEDLVQDAYVRALRGSSRFQAGTNLKAWLMTILRNLASNHRRDAYRFNARFEQAAWPGSEAVTPAATATPEEQMLQRSFAPQLQAALESMPKALRDAVWLCDVEELSYADIAARLRIPIGTVMSRISRGRRLLHQRLDGHVREDTR
jgi:RNA polymerase sigma-70 factor (ECF subfamily)